MKSNQRLQSLKDTPLPRRWRRVLMVGAAVVSVGMLLAVRGQQPLPQWVLVVLPVSGVLLLPNGLLRAYPKNETFDEHSAARLNRATVRAYDWLSLLVAVPALLLTLTSFGRELSSETLRGFLLVLMLVGFRLPMLILAWNEPDYDSELL